MSEFPALGVGEDSVSKTQCFSSTLLVDVRSCAGLKNKSIMGKSSPFIEVDVPGATPPTARTQVVKGDLDPTFNETMVFLLVPGVDEINIKVYGKGSVVVMGKTSDDTLGEAKKIKVTELFSQLKVDVPLDTQGTISLGLQLLPLAETSFMPAQLAATQAELALERKQVEALKTQSEALLDALSGANQESGAAKQRAADAQAAAQALELKIHEEKQRVAFLETQTASAKAKAALDAAKAKKDFFLQNSVQVMAGATAALENLKGKAVAHIDGAMSGMKAQLQGALTKDKALNGAEVSADASGAAEPS